MYILSSCEGAPMICTDCGREKEENQLWCRDCHMKRVPEAYE